MYTVINPCSKEQFIEVNFQLKNRFNEASVNSEKPDEEDADDAGQIIVVNVEPVLIEDVLKDFPHADFFHQS